MKARVSSIRAASSQSVAALEAKNRELTRALHMAQEARANLSDHYDFAPIGFMTLDAKGCIREINLTAAHLLGQRRSRLLTLPLLSYIAKGRLPAFLHHLSECRKGVGEIITDLAIRTRGGGALAVELRSVPVLDSHLGNVVYRTAMTDVGVRLQAAQALRESEERHRELVEHTPDGIFIQTAGAIVFANPAALRLCGVKFLNEIVGCQISEWVGPTFQSGLHAALKPSDPKIELPPIEIRFLPRNGAAVEVELSARHFRYDGEESILVTVRDITRRKTAERHALKISEHEKARFGRDLHDSLSQKLMGAAWHAEALRNRLRAANPRAAAEADEISVLIRDCMNEARNLARGLCPVTMEKSGLVAALHELSAGVASRMELGCTLECEESLIVEDIAVATNVYRIAQEAVTNAIKHGKARSILIQLGHQNGRTTLEVRDDGVGFPSPARKAGMGLHTMRYRASIIGGSLEVRSAPEHGTVVTCSFPPPLKS